MTTKLTAAGYIVQDAQGNAIHGVGATVEEAWAEVVDAIGTFHNRVGDEITPDEAFATQFEAYGATAALIAEVEAKGGSIAWRVVDGVACTCDEADALNA